jgi:hypothetical protein
MSELGHLALTDFAGPVQVVGDLAYYRLYDTDLVAVDIRDPGQMVEVGRYHPANPFCGFQLVERYAFVLVSGGDERSLHVVNWANTNDPQRVGRFVWESETPQPENLYVQGRYAFVALSARYGDATNRIDILDVGDPTLPVKVGEYAPELKITGLTMAGDTVYTTSDVGLTLLDFYAPNTSPNLRLNAPVLSGGVAVLTWQGGPGIKLQNTASLTSSNWEDVPGTLGQSVFALPPTDTAAFFRLIQQGD